MNKKVNKKKLAILLVAGICLFNFTACKNKLSQAVAGTYNGKAIVYVANVERSTEENVEIVIKSEGDDKVALQYPSFKVYGYEIPALNFSHITVSKEKKNKYQLSERAVTIKNSDYDITGLINGRVENNALTLNVTVNDKRISGSITVKYTAK